AALVFDGDEAVAWCEYGTPEELPNIYHLKEYEADLDRLPDYRITCFFVDKKYRRHGLTAIALRGALELIARDGGGVVEGYPHDTEDGKKVSVLYNSTRSLFERAGFSYLLPKGKRNCVLRLIITPAAKSAFRTAVEGHSRTTGPAARPLANNGCVEFADEFVRRFR